MSLGLKWVSCKQHIDGSCFLIHSVILCLLIETFSPLTFIVSTERYEFSAIVFSVGVSHNVLWSFLVFVAFGLFCFVFSPLKGSALKFFLQD